MTGLGIDNHEWRYDSDKLFWRCPSRIACWIVNGPSDACKILGTISAVGAPGERRNGNPAILPVFAGTTNARLASHQQFGRV